MPQSSRIRRTRRLRFEPLESRLPLAGMIPPVYTPTAIEVDREGVIYLLSEQHDQVYRWSVEQDDHLPSIDVGDSPRQLAFSEAHENLYVGYASGGITQIDLAANELVEQFFAVTPGEVVALEAADQFVFAVDPSRDFSSHYTFAVDGQQRSVVDLRFATQTLEWSSANKRMYFSSANVSPRDFYSEPINATGQIGDDRSSPYHGGYDIQPPIRVSRDGSLVVLGAGDVYDAVTLEIVTSLPNSFSDAAWLDDGSLITIREFGGHTLLEHRDAQRQLVNSQGYIGSPLRVLDASGEVTVITSVSGRPSFTEFVPTDDIDGDGVNYRLDAFPWDSASQFKRPGCSIQRGGCDRFGNGGSCR